MAFMSSLMTFKKYIKIILIQTTLYKKDKNLFVFNDILNWLNSNFLINQSDYCLLYIFFEIFGCYDLYWVTECTYTFVKSVFSIIEIYDIKFYWYIYVWNRKILNSNRQMRDKYHVSVAKVWHKIENRYLNLKC